MRIAVYPRDFKSHWGHRFTLSMCVSADRSTLKAALAVAAADSLMPL